MKNKKSEYTNEELEIIALWSIASSHAKEMNKYGKFLEDKLTEKYGDTTQIEMRFGFLWDFILEESTPKELIKRIRNEVKQ